MKGVIKKRHIALQGAIALLFTMALLSGCGLTIAQKKAVTDFTSATAVVGKTASAELARMREEVISMNVYRIQLVGEKKDAPGLDKLEEQFTIEATVARQRATEALKSYGELLEALVETDQAENIKKSSDALVGSFHDLPDSYRNISQDKLDAIGKALQAAGGSWIEWKKGDAIKTVVNNTNAQIAHLCDLLKDDFDPEADGKLASQFLNTTERLLVDADEVIGKSKSFEERTVAIAAYQKARENRVRRDMIVKPLSVSIGKIKDANNELVKVVNSTEFTDKDIEALQKNVKILNDTVRVLAKK
jgi:hypothetical protein